jgi:hypothetical protein
VTDAPPLQRLLAIQKAEQERETRADYAAKRHKDLAIATGDLVTLD